MNTSSSSERENLTQTDFFSVQIWVKAGANVKSKGQTEQFTNSEQGQTKSMARRLCTSSVAVGPHAWVHISNSRDHLSHSLPLVIFTSSLIISGGERDLTTLLYIPLIFHFHVEQIMDKKHLINQHQYIIPCNLIKSGHYNDI